MIKQKLIQLIELVKLNFFYANHILKTKNELS